MATHELAAQYLEGLRTFGQVMPGVMDAYNLFTTKCFAPGELSTKEKHLIALGISLFAGNEHCIVYHLEALRREGVSHQQLSETVAVAGAYGGGTTMSHGVILINEVMKKSDLQ
ncbi:carboxymuconolactone decarboxylase family protein [Brevibacillus fluminis]|uniref:Carboxymuconolactone decarboxylase family protein n=1 Tax=Brevibacillus fluminis TaxID=511487 RepID=A0A3M8DAK9_9BACL|nr:carboxymuconolactone decarboxylase family protein [Brevibacillus fluminis]RNB85084.1 carboxymuconolactone decarboxylase family protein [Brevibacillus fluminis]